MARINSKSRNLSLFILVFVTHKFLKHTWIPVYTEKRVKTNDQFYSKRQEVPFMDTQMYLTHKNIIKTEKCNKHRN